jgi:hypothetical protein
MFDRFRQKQKKLKTIDLEAMLKEVEQKAIALDQCAERILTKATLETHKTASEMQTELHVLRSTAIDIKGTTADISATTIDTGDKVMRLGVAANQFARDVNTSMRAQSSRLGKLDRDIQMMNMDTKKLIDGIDAQNGTLMIFAETINSTSPPLYCSCEMGEPTYTYLPGVPTC